MNHRPLAEVEQALVEPVLEQTWLRADIEAQTLGYAIANLVPQHLRKL